MADCLVNYGMICMFLIIIFLVINQQKMSKKVKENFALTPDDLTMVRNEINRIYDMDVEAIRNLGHISKSLLTGTNTFTASATGTPGTLTIPADNTILQGNLTMPAQGNLAYIRSPGRMHITGNETLYILNKNGVNIGKYEGGNGNLTVEGTATINGALYSASLAGPSIDYLLGQISSLQNQINASVNYVQANKNALDNTAAYLQRVHNKLNAILPHIFHHGGGEQIIPIQNMA